MKKIILLIIIVVQMISCSSGGGGSNDDSQEPGESDLKISGIVRISGNAFFDYDPKDSSQEVNNSWGKAQYITSGSQTGGYVNGIRDDEDWYLFDGLKDQVITFSGDSFLSVSAGTDPLNMTGFSEPYSLTVSGKTYIKVSAGIASAGSYKIDISSTSVSSWDGAEFVEGEVIVKFKEKARRSLSFALKGYDKIELKKDYGTFSVFTLKESSRRTMAVDGGLRKATLDIIEELNKREDVEYAEPNLIRRLSYSPNDYYYDVDYKLWNLDQIKVPYAWDISRGDGVVVAVLDSGIALHEEFPMSRIISPYDFVDKDIYPLDQEISGYHGSHVAGIIAAEMDNGKGIAGVAPGVEIMPVRIVDENDTISSKNIAEAIKYAAGISNSSGTLPTKPARIINMSFGGPGDSGIESEAIGLAASKGIVLVASAGNFQDKNEAAKYDQNNLPPREYPAAYTDVISVSAVSKEKLVTWYSYYGNWVDLAAPGGDGDGSVASVSGSSSSDYVYMAGTSMAAPHVSGVAALMLSLDNSLDSRDINNLIASGKLSNDEGASGFDIYYGYGLINAKKAVLNLEDYHPHQGVKVYLKDKDGGIIKTTTALKNGEGGYSYSFTGLDSGDYFIEAGADINNDNDFSDYADLKSSGPVSVSITNSSKTVSEINISL